VRKLGYLRKKEGKRGVSLIKWVKKGRGQCLKGGKGYNARLSIRKGEIYNKHNGKGVSKIINRRKK